MKLTEFDPQRAVGGGLVELDRQGLCEFAVKLCERVKAEVGAGAYRGGVFPDNISIDADGNVAIGPAAREGWTGQELDFLPPELYWNRRPGAASDVYAIGLVLYYAVSGGKLPFDGECRDPQLRRMGGDEFAAPKAAGRRLGDIIKKATAFKPAERYQSMDELRVMLESCLKNLYLNGAPSAETIFNKSDDDLNEIERLMVGIIERDEDKPLEEAAPSPPAEEAAPAEGDDTAEADADVDADAADGEAAMPAAPEEDAQAEDFRLAAEVARSAGAQGERVMHLYVEKNPEIEPIVLQKKPEVVPVVQYPRNLEKERRMEEEAKKRKRRPVAVILVLCAILVIVAIVFNVVIKNINRNMEQLSAEGASAASAAEAELQDGAEDAEAHSAVTPVPTVYVDPADILPIEPEPEGTPYIPGNVSAEGAAEAAQAKPAETAADASLELSEGHRYELYIEDISWTDAQKRCAELGGHLAVPNDSDEFVRMVELAESVGMTRVWIGGHRESGNIVWDDGSTDPYVQWAKGEPSYVDSSDGAAEDYVLLWYNNGWYYNDSRNDPCKEFPQWYGGMMSFICEYGE